MAIRTTAEKVKELLGPNYDTLELPKLNRFIRQANGLTDRMVTAAGRISFTHTSAELEDIETNLAAHFYTNQDKAYQSRNNPSGASGSFQGQTGMGLESSDFGQTAMVLDTSGCLRALFERKVASAYWGGKPKSDQLSYDERN